MHAGSLSFLTGAFSGTKVLMYFSCYDESKRLRRALSLFYSVVILMRSVMAMFPRSVSSDTGLSRLVGVGDSRTEFAVCCGATVITTTVK